MRVSIIGAGYVGLVTGVCLADKGHDVICVESTSSKVDATHRGVRRRSTRTASASCSSAHAGNSILGNDRPRDAVLDSDITFIAVGTPFDGTAIDLT